MVLVVIVKKTEASPLLGIVLQRTPSKAPVKLSWLSGYPATGTKWGCSFWRAGVDLQGDRADRKEISFLSKLQEKLQENTPAASLYTVAGYLVPGSASGVENNSGCLEVAIQPAATQEGALSSTTARSLSSCDLGTT